jgi:hypothetical protein
MSDLEKLVAFKSWVDTILDKHTKEFNFLLKEATCVNKLELTNFINKNEIIHFFKDSGEVDRLVNGITSQDIKTNANDYVRNVVNNKIKNNLDIFNDFLLKCELEDVNNSNKPLRLPSSSRSYDQVVKGDVKIVEIKNNSEYNYKITFHKIGKFLQYQVWDDKGTVPVTSLNGYTAQKSRDAQQYIQNNPDKVSTVNYELNNDRDVRFKNAKEWIAWYNSIPDFTPTTVMQIDYKKYVFVIKKAKINTNDKVVFYISTKEIHLDTSKKLKSLKKIPTDKHIYKNVRFDIDYGRRRQEQSYGDYYCPNGYFIESMNGRVPYVCQQDTVTCPSGQTLIGSYSGGAIICRGPYTPYCNGKTLWSYPDGYFGYPIPTGCDELLDAQWSYWANSGIVCSGNTCTTSVVGGSTCTISGKPPCNPY